MNVTMKNIKKEYPKIIKVGYCELQNLLRFKNADFTTSGVYGWNADIYTVSIDTAICTGYRPLGNIELKRDIIKKYDDKALKIYCNEKDYNIAIKKIDKLLQKFIEEVTK